MKAKWEERGDKSKTWQCIRMSEYQNHPSLVQKLVTKEDKEEDTEEVSYKGHEGGDGGGREGEIRDEEMRKRWKGLNGE